MILLIIINLTRNLYEGSLKMGKYLLGIDHGTGGLKACIVDDELNVCSYAFREYLIHTNNQNWSEHNPNKAWEKTCEVIKECIKEAGISPNDIVGIANSSALPSMVMVDKNHNPINYAYNLMDRRANKEVNWIKKNIGFNKIFDISANRLEDHPILVNLLWEKNNRTEDYDRIHKILTMDGFIRLKLTGEFTANYSSGAFFGVAYDLRNNEIKKDIISEMGIDYKKIPDFYPCEEIIGYTTKEIFSETGLPEDIPVSAGAVDCNAGWLSGGAVEPGDIQMNLGTCGVLGVIHNNSDAMLESMINCSYTTDSRNSFVSIATTTTGGQSLRYLRDNFSKMELAMEGLISKYDSYDYLNMQAEEISPGSNGLIILPFLMGERTPIWDVNARAVVFGLSLNHSKGHLIRAMMEGVGYALYDSFRILKDNYSLNLPLVFNEGGTKSKLWRRIITDIFNVPTVFLKERTGAPLGNAILAGVSTGLFDDFTIAKEKAEFIDRLDPIEKNHKIYMEYFDLYKDIYKDLKKEFPRLAELRNK